MPHKNKFRVPSTIPHELDQGFRYAGQGGWMQVQDGLLFNGADQPKQTQMQAHNLKLDI